MHGFTFSGQCGHIFQIDGSGIENQWQTTFGHYLRVHSVNHGFCFYIVYRMWKIIFAVGFFCYFLFEGLNFFLFLILPHVIYRVQYLSGQYNVAHCIHEVTLFVFRSSLQIPIDGILVHDSQCTCLQIGEFPFVIMLSIKKSETFLIQAILEIGYHHIHFLVAGVIPDLIIMDIPLS